MIRPIIEFFSDPLRLTMLIAGIFVIVLIYFFSRRPKLSKTSTAPENVATHPSDYQDLPEERGGVGKVVVKSAEQAVKEKPETPPAQPQFKETRAPIEAQAEAEAKEANNETVVNEESAPPTVVSKSAKLQSKAEKLIVLHLKSEEGRPYRGRLFVNAMNEAGMTLGEKQIFHHMADEHSNPYINFSVANMHEPGIFDLNDVDEFETRGLSFFMQVPMEVGNASLAFTQMMSTAQRLARRLGGELFTQDHKPLTVTEINALRVEVEKFV